MFDATMKKYSFKFGIKTDNDLSLGIHEGKITLSNEELKPVFDAVIDKIVTSCSSIIVSQGAQVRPHSSRLHTLNVV